MRGRRDEGGDAVLKREADGVGDLAAGSFVIANQARENRQTRGIGGRPGERALRVILQIPNGGGSCVPSAVAVYAGAIEFVEPAIVVVQNQDVAIAGSGIGVALDVGVCGNRHGSRIAFVTIGVEQ